MDNVIAFAPHRRPPEPETPAPLVGLTLRASLEEAAQTSLDAADKIISALDHLDEPSEPLIGRRAPIKGAQVKRFDAHGQGEPNETAALTQQAAAEPCEEPEPVTAPQSRPAAPPLPWGGSGNVIAAAGVALLDLVIG